MVISMLLGGTYVSGPTNSGDAPLDQDGKELITFTPEKEYSSVVISMPDIIKDGTYTITMGEEDQTIQMTDIIYSPAGGMGGGMGSGRKGEKQGTPPTGEGLEKRGKPTGERPKLPPEGIDGERPELPVEIS